jgi:hypothetical protein
MTVAANRLLSLGSQDARQDLVGPCGAVLFGEGLPDPQRAQRGAPAILQLL